jgi:hypothetical protein
VEERVLDEPGQAEAELEQHPLEHEPGPVALQRGVGRVAVKERAAEERERRCIVEAPKIGLPDPGQRGGGGRRMGHGNGGASGLSFVAAMEVSGQRRSEGRGKRVQPLFYSQIGRFCCASQLLGSYSYVYLSYSLIFPHVDSSCAWASALLLTVLPAILMLF